MNDIKIKHFVSLSYRERELLNIIYGNLTPLIKDRKKLIITSACNSEGKTYFAMNLARNIAEKGQKVVLIDADFRHSQLISTYQLTCGKRLYGLDEYLAGICEAEKVIARTNFPNLFIIPCCAHRTDPLSLLDNPLFFDLLDEYAKSFDRVIIDTSSAGLYMDAAQIASHCDGAIMVTRFNKTRRSDFMESCQRIEKSGCPVLGVVMNRLSFLSISVRKYYSLLYRTFKSK